ncbi:hypothetical protein CB172_13100 [Salmonella enterica subsp. enterica serovar Claibornei]|nr:hypothetical protein [Salmonella enterica subsp. enterica serovar Claibornei]
MNRKKEKMNAVDRIITVDWLKNHIKKTQEYDTCDWYLALSARKKVYDYLSWYYDHPRGWLSAPGHITFASQSMLDKENRKTTPAWMTYLADVENNMRGFITFKEEYPTPDEYLQSLPSQPFTVIDSLEMESLQVLVITPENKCREYIATDENIASFMHTMFSDSVYASWKDSHFDITEINEQISNLSNKIASGEILTFSEEDRKTGSPFIKGIPPLSVTTLTLSSVFSYVEHSKEHMEREYARSKHPDAPDINWAEVRLTGILQSENYTKSSVFAEINLMRPDSEIIRDFGNWLKQIRRELNTPSPARDNDTIPAVEDLAQTLALAYIDFKVVEFSAKVKKAESFFSNLVDDVSNKPDNLPFMPRYKEQVKDIAVKVMSDSFLYQLTQQIAADPLKK